MSRRAKHPEEEIHDNHDRWLLTYSDMITLLMVLFIVLFALGQTNIRKFNAFRESFHTASISPDPVTKSGIGVLSADSAVQLSPHLATRSPSVAPEAEADTTGMPSHSEVTPSLQAVHRSILTALTKAGLAGDVEVRVMDNGLAVNIATDKILFATDSAVLLPLGVRILQVITPVLKGISNALDIEGHTDNQAITGGPYPTNWALSTARALSVLQDLINDGVAPARMVASGFGDTRPLVPNTTPANRSINRRVEIVILSSPLVS